jgi:hypothetical protein
MLGMFTALTSQIQVLQKMKSLSSCGDYLLHELTKPPARYDWTLTHRILNYVCFVSLVIIHVFLSFQIFVNGHRSSPKYVAISTPTPLLIVFISSVPSFVMPTPTACSFPSAKTNTDVSAGRASPCEGSHPPFDVKPGHIMCAPARRNRIAPRSTPTLGRTVGSDEVNTNG